MAALFPSVVEEEHVFAQACRVVHEPQAWVEPVAHHPNTELAGEVRRPNTEPEEVRLTAVVHHPNKELKEVLPRNRELEEVQMIAVVQEAPVGRTLAVEDLLMEDPREDLMEGLVHIVAAVGQEVLACWMVPVAVAVHKQQEVVVLPLAGVQGAEDPRAWLVLVAAHKQQEVVVLPLVGVQEVLDLHAAVAALDLGLALAHRLGELLLVQHLDFAQSS